MQRIPEAELMNEDTQAYAYAMADFEAPHSLFVKTFCQIFSNVTLSGNVLDLGCGSADVTRRFAQTFPACHIDGVDGSRAMLKYGQMALETYQLKSRIRLIHGYLPQVQLPLDRYDAIICNSLLHHLSEPQVLWNCVKSFAKPNAPIFIMDLIRPESRRQAEILVQEYAANEPEILRRDFFNSLLAAYRLDEVQSQLQQSCLAHCLQIREVSDRHFIVSGRFNPLK